jgi:hypothetical protein
MEREGTTTYLEMTSAQDLRPAVQAIDLPLTVVPARKNYEQRGFRVFKQDGAIESLPSLPLEPWPGATRGPALPKRATK